MAARKRGRVVNDLRKLRELFPQKALTEAPKFDIPELEGISGIEANIQTLNTTLEYGRQVKDWMVTQALPVATKLEEALRISPRFDEMPFRHTEADDETTETEETKTNKEVRESIQSDIQLFLNHEEPIVSQFAELGKLLFVLAKPMGKEELEDLLEEDGAFMEDEDGQINAFGRKYSVNPETFRYICREAEEEIAGVVSKQVKRIRDEYSTYIQSKEEKFEKQSEITPLEAWQGKSGLCAMKVTDGKILTKINDEDIKIIDAVGRPERGFKEKIAPFENDYPVNVLWDEIQDSEENLVDKNHRLSVDVPKKVYNRGDGEVWFKGKVLAFHLIRTGFEMAMVTKGKEKTASQPAKKYKPDIEVTETITPDSEETTEKIIQKMKVLATLTSEELHKGETSGLYLLEFPEWTHFDKKVVHPCCLIRVSEEDDGVMYIQIVQTLPHCEEFFSNCREQYEIGEKWSGVSLPLGNMLKRDFAINITKNDN